MDEVFNTDDIYASNANLFKQLNIAESIKSIEDDISMMNYLSDLFCDKSFVRIDDKVINLFDLFQSVQLTLYSVFECYRHFCIADTYTLIRKYKDDLFFYLFLLVYSVERNRNLEDVNIKNKEKIVRKWRTNKLNHINATQIFDLIKDSELVKEPVKTYKLEDSIKKIQRKLNNYVHCNGMKFTNGLLFKQLNNIQLVVEQLQEISEGVTYITVIFLFLLILCVPSFVMAFDYIDSLESGQTPIDGSQYFVAPFVVEYLNKHLDVLDSSCYQYLKDNTPMLF